MTIQEELRMIYRNGDRITNKDLKRQLQRLYRLHDIQSKAKATDIRLFGFSARRTVIRVDGKRVEGLEINKI